MGAILIGVFIGAALWGISCGQLYNFYNHYVASKRLQLVVLTSFMLDTAHQMLVCHMIYTYLVTWYRDPSRLEDQVWSLIVQVLISGINAFLVQVFFLWQIWLCGKRAILIFPLVLIPIAGFALSIGYYVKATFLPLLTETNDLKNLSLSVNIMGMASDISISIVFAILVYKSKAELTRSARLIVVAMLATSICAMLSLITVTTLPNTFIFITFYVPLSKRV
ncbi:hypothetical protein OBBRIDRAFT_839960 [Obba rivulosa]|uniref:Uncharacterized protein n=1 Tax=Obba rivulosa TaxID=1052685 RepID=A0A8E2DEN7_9APHY|nr:hypothetical protein OBBRIDRAFT_839960 [Obba rivulosa]